MQCRMFGSIPDFHLPDVSSTPFAPTSNSATTSSKEKWPPVENHLAKAICTQKKKQVKKKKFSWRKQNVVQERKIIIINYTVQL